MNKRYYYRQHKYKETNRYYVYLHKTSDTGVIFYVGKGSGYRAWSDYCRNPYWINIKNKHGFTTEILFDDLEEDESYLVERDVILELRYFGIKLTNLSDGGEGGYNPSQETRVKQRLVKLGKPPPNKGMKQPSTSGVLNPSSDKNEYTFINKSGEIFIGTRYDFLAKYNYITNKQLGKLFIKFPNKTCKNWRVQDFDYKFYKDSNEHVFTFCRVIDGLQLTCSISYLADMLNIPNKYIARMVRGNGRNTTHGWTTKEYYDNKKAD